MPLSVILLGKKMMLKDRQGQRETGRIVGVSL